MPGLHQETLSTMRSILSVIFRFSVLYRKQKRYLKESTDFNRILRNSKKRERIEKYATFVPVFAGESYCLLRGCKMSPNERKALTALGALTGLFDDFTDENNLTVSDLMQIIKDDRPGDANETERDLLIRLFNIVKENTGNDSALYDLIEKTCHAQVESRKQTNPDTGIEELKEITFNKGGYSMQLYSLAFDGNSDTNELKLFYTLGAIGQLENDIFDIYSDFTTNTRTLATDLALQETGHIYRELKSEILNLVAQINYESSNKKAFVKAINFILARGFVAIDQLRKLGSPADKPLTLSQYSRKQLICDMEKPQNILKLIRFSGI